MVQIALTADTEITSFGRDLGTGTSLPTTGPASTALRRGDAYFHTTYGALFLWNGTAWRARGPGELTSTQRAALATGPYAGFPVFETDTLRTVLWTGTAWQYPGDSQPAAIITTNQTSPQPTASSWGVGTLTLASQRGGFPAITVNDRFQLPTDPLTAGLWLVTWRIVLAGAATFSGPVNTMAMSIGASNSFPANNPPDAKMTVGAAGDGSAQGVFLLNCPAGAWLLPISYLTLSATTTSTSRFQLTRVGSGI